MIIQEGSKDGRLKSDLSAFLAWIVKVKVFPECSEI